jgi:apolipoprotein N-acyltransferase
MAAAGWVAMEMVVARIFGGFPWNLLGASQYQLLPVIQFASITGVYGVSFLMVWMSVSLLCAVALILRRPARHSVWIGAVALPFCAVLAAFFHGHRVLARPEQSTREVRLTLIQPSIPQTLIWDPANDEARFRELLRMSSEALTDETDILVWPEAAIPGLLRYEEAILNEVSSLARRHRVWVIVGADDAEPRRGSSDPGEADYFNSSFLVSPNGELMNRYRKRNLVIFGEYIPFERSLPFIKALTPWIPGSFTPGDKAVPFEFTIRPRSPIDAPSDLRVTTSVLICFEDNFPHLVPEYADAGTDFLLNLTNNGWFGESAAQWQHAANSMFRAIENGLPLVRCTNNGLTCWVDARGRVRQIFRDSNGTVYGKGILRAVVPLPDSTARQQTFYNRHRDRFGWSCGGVAAAGLLLVLVRERRKQS